MKETIKKQSIESFIRFQPGENLDGLPLLLLPRIVVFPNNVLPLTQIEGFPQEHLEAAEKGKLKVGLVTQVIDAGDLDMMMPKEDQDLTSSSKNTSDSSSSKDQPRLSACGTEAQVSGVIRLNNGKIGLIVKGVRRFFIRELRQKDDSFYGDVTVALDYDAEPAFGQNQEEKALITTLKHLIHQVLRLNQSINHEAITILFAGDDPNILCDVMAQNLSSLSVEEKLVVLSTFSLKERLDIILNALYKEIELLKLSHKIQDNLRDDMQEGFKKNFLKEQMNAIRKELGEDAGFDDEIKELEDACDKKRFPDAVQKTVRKELKRLKTMHPSSPEYHTTMNYLVWLQDLPWNEEDILVGSKKNQKNKEISLEKVIETLEKDHYGLQDVKDRIVEHLAVLKHKGEKGDKKGSVLLFDGPPGVGKTSLGLSIAKALGRPFKRISLGGVKDEAEIRGHRRTYVGAMPGKILQAIKECGSSSCVLLLDEIDKVGKSHHGDVASALLEVLDPEQNSKFTDHFLGVPYDLSKVLFIATSNNFRELAPPLLDRMETIHLSTYTDKEKMLISKKHLIPKLRKDLNLAVSQFKVSDKAISLIINHYTKESGVRSLSRQFEKIGRKLVKEHLLQPRAKLKPIDDKNLQKYLGVPRFIDEPYEKMLPPGVVTGLAYTAVGGDILFIESQLLPEEKSGSSLMVTGSLGNVMQESAKTVFSYIKAKHEEFGIDKKVLQGSSIHLHVPDGATPKDGPSAGIAMFTSLVSLLKKTSVSSSVAMTGEATLRGQVLPVGGIKEKLLAAYKHKKKIIILPASNVLDLEKIDKDVLKSLTIYPVRHMDEVLKLTGLLKNSPKKEQLPSKPFPWSKIGQSPFKGENAQ